MLKRIVVVIAIVVAVIVAGFGIAYINNAPDGILEVEGYLTDASGNPIENADVYIGIGYLRQCQPVPWNTDSNGWFHLEVTLGDMCGNIEATNEPPIPYGLIVHWPALGLFYFPMTLDDAEVLRKDVAIPCGSVGWPDCQKR